MKKSECFRRAQIAVVNDASMLRSDKLAVLEVLIMEESLARLLENNTEEEKEKESEAV